MNRSCTQCVNIWLCLKIDLICNVPCKYVSMDAYVKGHKQKKIILHGIFCRHCIVYGVFCSFIVCKSHFGCQLVVNYPLFLQPLLFTCHAIPNGFSSYAFDTLHLCNLKYNNICVWLHDFSCCYCCCCYCYCCCLLYMYQFEIGRLPFVFESLFILDLSYRAYASPNYSIRTAQNVCHENEHYNTYLNFL